VASDELAGTVDYATLADQVAAIVAGPPRQLLEHVAGRIADRALAEPRAHRVRVELSKPQVALPQSLEATAVRIERVRESTYWLGLGSNLGDRLANLQGLVDALRDGGVRVEALSPVYDTAPQQITDQPAFLNAVARVRTELVPRELLAVAKRAERRLGRTGAGVRFGPRPADCDILFWEGGVWHDAALEIPHPRLTERRFVLVPLLDVGAGLACALGLLAAYVERQRTGMGRLVSSSLLEFALTSLGTVAAGVLASGEPPGLLGTHSPMFAPYGGFRTADGWLVLAGAGSEDMWRRACRVLGRDDLVTDDRFADNVARVAHRDELTAAFESVLTTQPTQHWLARCHEAGVPAAQVQNLAQVLATPQLAALGSVQELGHPGGGSYRLIGPPLRMDEAVLPYPSPAPLLGADTRVLLTGAGLAAAEIDELVAGGIAVAP